MLIPSEKEKLYLKDKRKIRWDKRATYKKRVEEKLKNIYYTLTNKDFLSLFGRMNPKYQIKILKRLTGEVPISNFQEFSDYVNHIESIRQMNKNVPKNNKKNILNKLEEEGFVFFNVKTWEEILSESPTENKKDVKRVLKKKLENKKYLEKVLETKKFADRDFMNKRKKTMSLLLGMKGRKLKNIKNIKQYHRKTVSELVERGIILPSSKNKNDFLNNCRRKLKKGECKKNKSFIAQIELFPFSPPKNTDNVVIQFNPFYKEEIKRLENEPKNQASS